MSLTSTLLPLLLLGQLPGGGLPAALTSPPCVACKANIASMRATYSDADWQALVAGEIVTSEGEDSVDGMVEHHARSSGIVAAPPGRVWEVIMDFGSRPQYMPNVKEVRLVRVEGNQVWLAERLGVAFMTIRYQIIGTVEPEQGMVRWALDPTAPHDIKSTKGSWQMTPLTDGQKTLLTYKASVETGKPIPRFIENLMLKRSLPRVVDGVRNEILRRAAR